VIAVWWEYIVIAAVLALGVYGFMALVGFQTRILTRRTDRTAESMYRDFADARRKRRRRDQG
jgi:hypothetical protein